MALGKVDEYEDGEDRRALVPSTKTNYLLPCDVSPASLGWSLCCD